MVGIWGDWAGVETRGDAVVVTRDPVCDNTPMNACLHCWIGGRNAYEWMYGVHDWIGALDCAGDIRIPYATTRQRMHACMHAFVAAWVNPTHTNARRETSIHMLIHMPIHKSLNMHVHMLMRMSMRMPIHLRIYMSGVRFDTCTPSHTTRAHANVFISLHADIYKPVDAHMSVPR